MPHCEGITEGMQLEQVKSISGKKALLIGFNRLKNPTTEAFLL